MVLTRLSHFGEVCPLSDHSYSDPAAAPSSSSTHHLNKRITVNATSKSSSSSCATSSTSTTNSSPSFSTSSLPTPSPSPPPSGTQSSSASSSSPSTYGSTSLCTIGSSRQDVRRLELLDLPNEIFEKIFSYLTYKKTGEIRLTSKRFEQIGSIILNTAFQRLQNQMLQRFQCIKGQMPRRESARRKHPLARESDIFETLHMRLTLLQMSFGKHIERKHCCFFAGDILDEVYRILSHIKKAPNLGRAYKVTDELFDLSSMAMEYFKEHIEPRLPEITYFGSDFLDITSRFSEGCGVRSPSGSGRVSEPEDELPERDPLPPSNMVLRKRIRRIRQGMRRYNSQLVALKRELKGCKGKVADQHKQLLEYSTRMDEYDKKFEESSRKFSTVLQELNKCKTELQYWRSKSPAHPLLCYSCGQSVSEGMGQQLQAGVLMQGGEEAVVYVPLSSAAAVPDSVEKSGPGVVLARDESQDRWQAVGGSVRNLERVFDMDLSNRRSSESTQKPSSSSSLPCSSFPTLSCSQASVSPHNVSYMQGWSASRASDASNPGCVSQPASASLPPHLASQTMASSYVGSAPGKQNTSCMLPASPTPITPRPLGNPQAFSAFHACGSTQEVGQECAEDLSVTRHYKGCHEEAVENHGSTKRCYSDDDSDNCDITDDTVGRRVKERKRVKVDTLQTASALSQ
ncbi:hypothetical protein Pmani_026856 [Petrolisthes manimaculis]|uniref:F-box domain-containing protein n=1 Tax=Petrolisthes manimaculis TaxID=1843537 RepID=A0AAE1P2S5_9EUCA|nr:hypothetical protein Pmani_026856 [Petrolisthes manimaculis]